MTIGRPLKSFYIDMASNERRRLLHFSISAVMFFVCYGFIYSLDNMPPSTKQELAAALCIAIGALSFAYALLLQLIYIASKIIGLPK